MTRGSSCWLGYLSAGEKKSFVMQAYVILRNCAVDDKIGTSCVDVNVKNLH